MAVDNFIPEIWHAQLLDNLKNALVFGNPNFFNRNYTGDISSFGDTVHINSIGAVTVTDYVKNIDHAAPEQLSDSQMTLVVDQAKMFNFQIDDVDAAQTRPNLQSAAMFEAGFALANVADQFLSNLLNIGVPTANTLPTSAFILATNPGALYNSLVDAGVVLDANNAPAEGRWAVASPKVYGALLKDPRFVSFGTDQNRAVISSRNVGTIAGFTVMQSNTVPASGASNPQVLIGHNIAATYAEQISELRAYRPEKRFADAVKGLHVYGGKIIRPELTVKFDVTFA